MELTAQLTTGASPIASYGDGGFVVGGERVVGNALILPDRVVPWNGEVDEALLFALMPYDEAVELLIIGAGKENRLIPTSLRARFKGAGIGIEAMDTGAACRTYNILLSESRRVAAALIAV